MNKQQFDKRIAGYSALAAALMTTSQAGASVVKYSAGDFVLNSNGAFYNIDFDQDGGDGNDIMFYCWSFLSSCIFYVINFDAGDGGAFLGPSPIPPIMYPFVLNASNSVPETGAWNLNYSSRGTLNVYSGYAGFWNNKINKFMGVRFNFDEETHYGWVRMSCTPTTLTIHEFAYETDADTGIDSPLPVEISLFNAVSENGAVKLTWTTESEKDNLGFILERRLKGATDWEQISSYLTNPDLKGQGTKTTRTEYAYCDETVAPEQTYRYRLTYKDVNGQVFSENILEITTDDTIVPDHAELLAAYPNPFNPGTTIQYKLANNAQVSLEVIDITGRTVRSIVSEYQAAGSYSFAWDGKNNSGNSAPSGVYLLVLKAGDEIRTQKVTRLR